MAHQPLNSTEASSRFFSNYIKKLEKHNIPEKQRRWYVRHIEQFITAQSGHKIKSLTGIEITRYLQALGRQNHLPGWAFAQRIDAIKILYSGAALHPG